MRSYTLVVTSCGRFDLLKETLRSFYARVDVAPAEAAVVEDSIDARVTDVMADLGFPARVLVNTTRLGQMRAIDRVYAEVRTPYTLSLRGRLGVHARRFHRGVRGPFLKALPSVSMVGMRPGAELKPLVRRSPSQRLGAVAYFEMDPRLHPEYFTSNPGLRRLADYQRLGPYAPLGGQEDVSCAFKTAGFRIANLEVPAVCHIGHGRHIDDPTLHRRARTLGERLARSTFRRLQRAQCWGMGRA